MIEFNEYIPRGGWVKHRRRQRILDSLKAWAAGAVLVAAYAVCGYIERGM